MKLTLWVALTLSLFPLSCANGQPEASNAATAASVITHYFGGTARISDALNDFYAVGDLDGDGLEDLAVLFDPGRGLQPAAKLRSAHHGCLVKTQLELTRPR